MAILNFIKYKKFPLGEKHPKQVKAFGIVTIPNALCHQITGYGWVFYLIYPPTIQ